MGFLDYVASRWQLLLVDSYQHASMVVQCIVLATIVGVLVGVAVYRSPAGAAIATALSSAVLTIPSFALFGLLLPFLGLGVAPSVVTLVLYALLPIVRNTIVGLSTVDQPILDAARGIGMSRFGVLTRVELRLAWPAILAGMRVSTQMLMGIAAIAAYAKGPGLGNLVFSGLSQLGGANAVNMALAGTLGVIVLALLLDAIFVLIGRLTTSRGIRG
ncbi:osmoprotectant transport system permease protein [Saccharopolyspora erythraea NRRL 2338]|uniref:ABC quaternary amine transporter, permease component n=2 Tax=Saccharopolyspora erythraea TaxID=1836 RepID=A4F5V6_SACEN|nr:ABC transporter permease [Saccharopolyspora erythraea]EQD84209.1 ABC transporter permease [Saccharopolyspora erythraea D]PFG93229.1 osmoprotectant transport system permease protein [Saccharopolyspora erythraea NRRL 2338]QRK90084.1 ABC transporter permease [Saccharopolyspora erythraea]CAL99430.1 ABC quaternary amine transporter, permease component [Saccharopolyspora erythraea NRRL 2338]